MLSQRTSSTVNCCRGRTGGCYWSPLPSAARISAWRRFSTDCWKAADAGRAALSIVPAATGLLVSAVVLTWLDWRLFCIVLAASTLLQAILQAFINSPEFQTTYGSLNNTAFVNLVYQNVLGRAPDAGGLNFWVGQLTAGVTRADMMNSFVGSAEFQNRILNRALATLLYMGFLRRSPEPAGFAFWLGSLNNGLAGANAIDPFIGSLEYLLRF